MSLDDFSNVWAYSRTDATTLLVHLAIADTLGPTRFGEVHLQYLCDKARTSIGGVETALETLEHAGYIKNCGFTSGRGQYVHDGSYMIRLLPCLPQQDTPLSESEVNLSTMNIQFIPKGYVYLLKCGPYFKIGFTKNVQKRMAQLAIQLPHKPELICSAPSGEPEEMESYWHEKFSSKRMNGEWFALDQVDIQQFSQYATDMSS